jgi:CHAT domain-containing protein/tetratricopeptide (TPR) repeat protein
MRRTKNGRRLASVATVGLALSQLILAARAQEPTRIDPAKPTEREIASGQSHEYVVEVPAGAFFHADVEQKGIDVAVSVFDPAGAQLTEVDSLTGAESAESVSLVAKTAGAYRIVVHVGEGSEPPSGKYAVVAAAPRPATPKDQSLVDAEYAAHEGLALYLEESDEGRNAALAKYQAALTSYVAAGDRRGEADTLSILGTILLELHRADEAIPLWERELPVRREIKDVGGEAVALNNVGVVYYQRSDFRKAQGYFQRALDIAKAGGAKEQEAVLKARLANILSALGKKREAIAAIDEALPLVHESAPPEEEARLLLTLGGAYYDMGDRAKALDAFDRSLGMWRALVKGGTVSPAGESEALMSAGSVYGSYGDRERALVLFKQARDLSASIDDKIGVARAHLRIGATMFQLGDNAGAIENYTKALALSTETGFKAGELSALNNLGNTYAQMIPLTPADARNAVNYLTKAVAGYRATNARVNEAESLNNLGDVYVHQRNYPLAISTLTRAQQLARQTSNKTVEAIALKLTGDAYAGQRNYTAALAAYEKALPLARVARFAGADATVLRGIARVERDRGRLDEAKAKIEEAIAIVESVRSQLSSQENRASFFSSARPYYDFYVDLLMRMHRREPTKGYDAEALRASERARARSLVELLASSKTDVRGGLDPAVADKLASLREDLAAKTIAETRALASGDEETLRGARAEMGELSDAYNSALEEARASSPRFAEIAQPTSLGVDEIRSQVLDADTALVEYFLGDERGYAWIVTAGELKSYALPARSRVEASARRVYELLAGPGAAGTRDLKLSGAPEVSAARAARAAHLEREYLAAAAPLSQMVLGPAARDIAGKRLLVVADGALSYVPFGALPLAAAGAKPEPLIVTHEVVYAPSASAVAVMRRDVANRTPAAKLLAMFADPVFDTADSRVQKGAEKPTEAPADDPLSTRSLQLAAAKQSANDSGFAGQPSPFPRLEFTRQEADAISALAPEDARAVATDFAASRAAATAEGVGSYRIVHFATHGYLNSVHPELSGLVLSLVDEKGEATPGFLATPDVFNMRLGSDLVVLSACNTGLGKEVRGEGICGLTRGFMYAGSPRVVVSLWSVNDRATATLMTDLYDGMLKKGMTPAAALRAAQLSIWKQAQWRAPFYWAPFVLQGEWR